MASPMRSDSQQQQQQQPPAGLKDDGSGAAAPADETTKTPSLDGRYHFDQDKLNAFKKEAPWTNDAKYFTCCTISPSAVMKMMMHCQSGVTKGVAKGGNPIEVMGLLMGRPDYTTPKTLIVTDAFPLPIEGFETRVIADDENVVNHMIALGECLERTRKEKFMGWYHSHPFDLGDHSHCFLSQTDLSTQLQWQRAEDPHGNPFVAIVIDPLRSIHTSTPELKAFRAYPPEYNSPIVNECPDGSVQVSEQTRLEHWGSCWNRYYELQVEYYMSSTARTILEQLTCDYLWMRTLGGNHASAVQKEQEELASKISKTALAFKTIEPTVASASVSSSSGGGGGGGKSMASMMFGGGGGGIRAVQVDSQVMGTLAAMSSSSSAAVTLPKEDSAMDKAVTQVVELASEQIDAATLEHAKQKVFRKSG